MSEHSLRPEDLFAEPTLLYFPKPENPRRGTRSAKTPQEGRVSLSFNVNEHGRVRYLRTVDSEPPKLMDFRVRRSMRVARFRPQYVEGKAVVAESQTFTYQFPYFPLQKDLEAESTQDAESASVQE